MSRKFFDIIDQLEEEDPLATLQTHGWEVLEPEGDYCYRQNRIFVRISRTPSGWLAGITSRERNMDPGNILVNWASWGSQAQAIDLVVGPYPRPSAAHHRIMSLAAKLGLFFPAPIRESEIFIDMEIRAETTAQGKKGG